MAITINGTGTITGISAGGLPDGSVTAADLATTLDLSGSTITLPSGTGGNTNTQYFTVTGKQTQTANVLSTTSFSNVREGSDSFGNTGTGNLNKVWEVDFTPTAGYSNALIRVLLNSYAEETNTQDYLGALLCVRHGTTWSHIDCSWQGHGGNEMGEQTSSWGATNDAYDHVWFVNKVSTTNLNKIAIALFSNISTPLVINDFENSTTTHTTTQYTSVIEVVEH